MIKNIEGFLKEIILHHGFCSNTQTGFSCYIPDPKPFSKKEELLLCVCTPKGNKVVTKLEHLVSKLRRKRLLTYLGISEKEFHQKLIPNIIAYCNSLSQFGFQNIGKGISVNVTPRIYNKSLSISNFKNDLKLLRDFEVFLINNPITLFAEAKGYFTIKEKNNFLFDR